MCCQAVTQLVNVPAGVCLQASEPGTIRGDYCIEVGRNVIHGSDSVENAQKEIALWFGGELSWHVAGEQQLLSTVHMRRQQTQLALLHEGKLLQNM